MGRMVTEVGAARESHLGWDGVAGRAYPAAAAGSLRHLSVPLLASVVVAEALAFGALATSGNIPVLVLKAFRLLLTL